MTELDAKLRSAIDRFVDEMSALVRQAALDCVRGAFDGGKPAGRATDRRAASVAAPVSAGRRGAKRSPEALEKLTAVLLGQIKKDPGQRIETIAVALGVATKELALPAQKLLAAKQIKTQGQKRATKYLPR